MRYIYVVPPSENINDIVLSVNKLKDYLDANDIKYNDYSLRTFRGISNECINNVRIILGLPKQQYYDIDTVAPLYYDLITSKTTVTILIAYKDIIAKLFIRDGDIDIKANFYAIFDDSHVEVIREDE